MDNFRDWFEQEIQKPWKATKPEILNLWRNLPGFMPIQTFKPVPDGYQGSTYKYDGVRITGSGQFVNAIASRLKDLADYEGDGKTSKLDLIYHQQVDKKTEQPIPNSFVFYAQIKDKERDQYDTTAIK